MSKDNLLSAIKHHTPGLVGESHMKKYAVVIPLIKTEEGYDILFETRAAKIGRQPGDVCLPGGRLEPGEDPVTGGLRELREELMLSESQVHFVGQISTLVNQGREIVTLLAAEVTDYLGTKNDDEVAEIFTVPAEFFRNTEPTTSIVYGDQRPSEDFPFEKIHNGRDYQWRSSTRRVVFYEYENRVIWGMTGLLMEDFAIFMQNEL